MLKREDDVHSLAQSLGPCCGCERVGDDVRNIVMLPRLAPIPSTGWGCVQCRLPFDGAVAVVCDDCLGDYLTPPRLVCVGFPLEGKRMPYADLPRHRFDHIESMHPEMTSCDPPRS